MSDIGTAYVNIVPKAEGIKGALTKQLESSGDAGGTIAGNNIVGKIKGIIAGAAIGATIIKGIKMAVGEGANLEQSMGGIETLFKGSASTVIANAKKAYQTAGVSANEYMESVTSFSAGLIKSLDGDTTKAAKVADTAMIDMSDNANKMGTDIGSIQNAYQGFAKQNYTMLDNLKLGYGGTKTEMQRLLDDASKISGQKYDMSNLSDVYEAIHVVQGELGITGTTAKEASETISGSFGSMKAAFTDLMGNLALGEDISASVQNLVDTTITFLVGNLLPAIGNIFMSLPPALIAGFQALIPYVQEGVQFIIDGISSGSFFEAIMGVISDISNFITSSGIPQIAQSIMSGLMSGEIFTAISTGFQGILDTISAMIPAFIERGKNLIINLGLGFINGLPDLLANAATLAENVYTFLAGMVDKITAFINANAPKFIAAGGDIIVKLVTGLVKNLPQILLGIGKLVLTVGKGLLKLNLSVGKLVLSIGKHAIKWGLQAMQSLGQGIWNGIKGVAGKVKGWLDKITAPFRKVIDTIKGFFPLSIGKVFSNIKLPHFTVSGGKPPFGLGGLGVKPKFDVSWYAQGGIITQPTLAFAGMGEKGNEAIVPLDPFWKRLDKANGTTFNNTFNITGTDDPNVIADAITRRLELQMR